MLTVEKVFTQDIHKMSLDQLHDELADIINAREGYSETNKNGLWLDERYMEVDNLIQERTAKIKQIEDKVLDYEQGKMKFPDSEIEVNTKSDDIWLYDYSPSREVAVYIEKLCSTKDISKDDLIELCDSHDWLYAL